jgi:hypothetical protein
MYVRILLDLTVGHLPANRSNKIESMPEHCPTCGHQLVVTRLRCSECGTEVEGAFSRGRLVNLPEPHATLLELFLRSRGNMKEMERALGLAYSTVRARLDEAFARVEDAGETLEDRRKTVLDLLDRGEITVPEAVKRLRDMQNRR